MQSYTFGVLKALCGLTDLFSPLSFDTHSGPWSPYAKTNLGICFALYVQLWIQGPLSAWYMRASNNTLLPFHPLSPSLGMSRISAFICGGKRKKTFEHFVGEEDTLMTWGPLSVAFSCKVCFVQDVSTLRWDEIQKRVSALCSWVVSIDAEWCCPAGHQWAVQSMSVLGNKRSGGGGGSLSRE